MEERQILDGKYVVVRPLGEGATGTLFEAENLLLGKRVAVKMVRPALVERNGARERALSKARETAMLEHPNICGPIDLGEEDGAPYIVTEMLSGPSLQREIEDNAPLSVPAACDLVLQVLAALDYAHANEVVHGGLHPRNVHVVYPRPGVPWVKVTDFGLAVALEPVVPIRSEPYLAPEAQRGASTPVADVYSAGALLFALLHGQPPAGAEAKADPELVPAALRRSLEAALRADPEQRTQSAQLLASQLASYTLELPISGEFRLSLPSPSIRWIQASVAPAARVSLRTASAEPTAVLAVAANSAGTDSLAGPRVTDSLLRNPRFPSDRHSPWSKRWRQLRTHLASHPNVGVAWLFAVASLGAGIACALLAAWL